MLKQTISIETAVYESIFMLVRDLDSAGTKKNTLISISRGDTVIRITLRGQNCFLFLCDFYKSEILSAFVSRKLLRLKLPLFPLRAVPIFSV